jgi:hypothetical protein
MKNTKSVIILWDEKNGTLSKVHEVYLTCKIALLILFSFLYIYIEYRRGLIKFSPSGNLIVVAGEGSSEISLYDSKDI